MPLQVGGGEAAQAASAPWHSHIFPRTVLDSFPDAVVVLDQGGFVTYANRAVERLLGYPLSDVLEKPAALFVIDPKGFARIVEALRPAEPAERHELELRRHDGASVWVSLTVSCVEESDGERTGVMAALRDVSEERRALEVLARKNSELQHYVHAISHDLRSPLVSLLGFSRLLREDYGERLDEKGRHFLDRIEQAGRTMESLIHDLLEFSRIGQSEERKTPVDPREVLLQIRAELKPRIDAEGVEMVLPNNPPLVLCNRMRLYQLFSNLIGNALDHMGATDEPKVCVAIEEQPGGHRLAVRDNGRGIDPSHHDRIFEIFESLGPRANGQRSTGLGLAIVKKIAETHGGRCWVESKPGHGAAFSVLLPRS